MEKTAVRQAMDLVTKAREEAQGKSGDKTIDLVYAAMLDFLELSLPVEKAQMEAAHLSGEGVWHIAGSEPKEKERLYTFDDYFESTYGNAKI